MTLLTRALATRSVRDDGSSVPKARPRRIDREQKVTAALAAGWLVALVDFWRWWARAEHVESLSGMFVTSVLVSLTGLLPAWYFGAALRHRPRRHGPVRKDLRVATIVTKAPSEPWAVVKTTLEALLAQDFQSPFDVWLADEDPTEEVERWCDAHGVFLSCRRGVEEYHREDWPRRTRSKEGNLAYFYDHWGYDNYDVVAQFDADHAPTATYLSNVVPLFADDDVGYVAAPSICDTGADRSWAARGRLYREGSFHGAGQLGHDGLAPSCIGSHYAVRTAALRTIGGIGPELAEDYSTTFLLNAAGWRGRFAIDAIAHGEGPESFADAMHQELQWARSLMAIYLRMCPPHWRRLPVTTRIKLAFALVYYPVFVFQMAAAYSMGLFALWTGVPWVRVALAEYLVRAAIPMVFMYALLIRHRHRSLFRPANTPLIAWESALFHFARWPWVLVGIAQGVVGEVLGRTLQFRVTPKGEPRPKPLPVRIMFPYVALSLASTLTVLAVRYPLEAGGYYVFGLLNGTIYAAVAVVLILVHRRENPGLGWADLRSHLWLSGVTVAVLVCALAVRFESLRRVSAAAAFLPPATDPIDYLGSPRVLLWLAAMLALAGWAFRHRLGREHEAHPAACRWQPVTVPAVATTTVPDIPTARARRATVMRRPTPPAPRWMRPPSLLPDWRPPAMPASDLDRLPYQARRREAGERPGVQLPAWRPISEALSLAVSPDKRPAASTLGTRPDAASLATESS